MITALHGRQQSFTMTDGVNTYSIFAIEGGVVKIVNAKISQASIDNLMVGTSNIEAGAITQATAFNGGSAGSGTSYNYYTFTVNHGLESPRVKIEIKLKINALSAGARWIFDSITDGTTLDSDTSGNMPMSLFTSILITPPADRASTVFRIGTLIGGSGAAFTERTMIAYVFKR